MAPEGIRPASRMREIASGMVAAEVLPEVMMSSATIASSRRPSAAASGSIMRRFAWWGTNTSMSAMVRPAASTICFEIFGASRSAQPSTWRPCWEKAGPSPLMVTASASSGTVPHTTGEMPGSSEARSTIAPAPSAVRMQVVRSV